MDSPDSLPLEPIDPNANAPLLPAPPPAPVHGNPFIGPRGLRAGWKVFLFFVLSIVIGICFVPFLRMMPKVNPAAPMSPRTSTIFETVQLLAVLIPTGILAKLIDHQKWGYFGMPLSKAFRSKFWVGAIIGIGVLGIQLELMHLGGWFDFGYVQTHGAAAVRYGIVWLFMFTLVGLSEEGLLRGYVQRVTTNGFSMLGSFWSFWTSAIIFSIIFGLLHLGNHDENAFGIVMVMIDGMVMCFSLWRTGDLWWAIGNHMGWDWAQSFLFGTPNSGTHAIGALMHPSFHGPTLLAGGTDGPEGSVIVLLSEALFVVLIALLYPKRKYPLLQDEPPPQPETAPLTPTPVLNL